MQLEAQLAASITESLKLFEGVKLHAGTTSMLGAGPKTIYSATSASSTATCTGFGASPTTIYITASRGGKFGIATTTVALRIAYARAQYAGNAIQYGPTPLFV